MQKLLRLISGIFFLCVGWFLACPTQVQAATYYVDGATGNNGNLGTAVGQAWATVQYAATQAVAGDTVIIRQQ